MPETIKCPDCAKTLRVPEHLLGKTVRCPSCKLTFTAKGEQEADPEPIVENESPRAAKSRQAERDRIEERPSKAGHGRREDEEDEERVQDRPSGRHRSDEEEDERPRRKREREQDEEEDEAELVRARPSKGGRGTVRDWQKVRSGIGYILAGIFVAIGSDLLLLCGSFVFIGAMAGAANTKNAGATATTGMGGAVLIGILAIVIGLVSRGLEIAGSVFCMAAPPKHGAKPLAIASLCLLVVSLLLSLFANAIGLASSAPAAASPMTGLAASSAGSVMSLVAGLVGAGQSIVFLFFLRAIALAMREEGLARQIIYLLVLAVSAFFLAIAMLVILFISVAGAAGTATSGSGSPNALAGVGIAAGLGICFIALVALAAYIWYIVLLCIFRERIGRYIRRRR